tara:strand:- start:236 stop:448 length:213 start_codon:yes stop_codon:yes gene_type:complete
MNTTKLINQTKKNGSMEFQTQGEKFKLFIDWEREICLTHYSKNYKNNENSWCVGSELGLKNKINNLTNKN